MVEIKDKGLLLNIIEHCLRVEETIIGKSEKEFHENKDIQDIVCFNVLQIGELVKHLSQKFFFSYSGVPWKRIKGLRDIIVHGYGTINWDNLWITASEDIKPLRTYCEKIVEENK